MERSDAIQCLKAGAAELAAILGNENYHEPIAREALFERWMAKVTGAGLDESSARNFLSARLKGQDVSLWSFPGGEIIGFSEAESEQIQSEIPKEPPVTNDVYYGIELSCGVSSINDEIRATRESLEDDDNDLEELSKQERHRLVRRLEFLERQRQIDYAAALIQRMESSAKFFRQALESFAKRKDNAYSELLQLESDLGFLVPDLLPTAESLLSELQQEVQP